MAIGEIVFDTYREAQEKIMYGGIIFFFENKMFSDVFASKNYVTLEFSHGFLMNDPDGHLEGKGEYRRHLKIKHREDISTKNVRFFCIT